MVKVSELDAAERRRLLIDGLGGLEPAMFWLNERGDPLSASAWKRMFHDASARCQAAGVPLACHAHMLRHTFAVVTLEQLQRGQIEAMAGLTAEQRGHNPDLRGPAGLGPPQDRPPLAGHHDDLPERAG